MRLITLTVNSLQAAFGTALKGIIDQGGCATDGDECAYFQTDAVSQSRCAIGHLLTEEDAQWLQNTFPPSGLDTLMADRKSVVEFDMNGIDFDKLRQLQAIHDDTAFNVDNCDQDFIPQFHARMMAFAKVHKLVVPQAYKTL